MPSTLNTLYKLNKAKNKKRIATAVVCVILSAMTVLQCFASDNSNNIITRELTCEEFGIMSKDKNYYSAVNLNDEMLKFIDEESLGTKMDEFLDFYEKYSLYGLSRAQAVNLMLKEYILNYDNAVADLANSLLKALDPFGGYYSQTSISELFGNYYRGYGIVFEGKKISDGNKYGTTVKKVLKGSPALDAGLSIGDEIIKINNIGVDGFGVNAVSNLLSSVENKVDMTVRRNGAEINFTMYKQTVGISSLTFKSTGDSTALITVENFTDDFMVQDFYMILMYLYENKYKNLILDLRNNLGGDMNLMAQMLNMLVPAKDAVLFSLKYKDGSSDTVKSSGGGMKFDKICVLTNDRTASASEIFAMSLSEIAGAVRIGVKTYGKGVGQMSETLSSGDTVAVTAFEVLSSKGAGYHSKGLEPSVKIEPKYTDVKNVKFGQLNFVNCADIKSGADNAAVLALNQRLARIGYIAPEDITSKFTDKTATAVEIFQKYNNLPVGISKIDYNFINALNYYVSYSSNRYEEKDVQLECAETYILKDIKSAEDYAKNIK